MDRVDDKPAVLDQEGIIQAQLLLHGGVGFLGVVVAQHHLHRVAGGEAQDRINDEADTQQHRNQHEQPFENKTVHLSLSFSITQIRASGRRLLPPPAHWNA